MSNSDNSYNYYNSYNSYPYNYNYPAANAYSSPVSDRRLITGLAARSKSGGSSGYGSYSSGHGGHDSCCPLVVDPLTLIALTAFMAAAVYLLNEQIAMSMLGGRRKRSSPEYIREGRHKIALHIEVMFNF